MSPVELGKLLRFVTSCSRPPLGGFKYLHPPFTLHKVRPCITALLLLRRGNITWSSYHVQRIIRGIRANSDLPRCLPGNPQVECEASVLAMLGGKDVDRLPSASTCFNLLKLPNYR